MTIFDGGKRPARNSKRIFKRDLTKKVKQLEEANIKKEKYDELKKKRDELKIKLAIKEMIKTIKKKYPEALISQYSIHSICADRVDEEEYKEYKKALSKGHEITQYIITPTIYFQDSEMPEKPYEHNHLFFCREKIEDEEKIFKNFGSNNNNNSNNHGKGNGTNKLSLKHQQQLSASQKQKNKQTIKREQEQLRLQEALSDPDMATREQNRVHNRIQERHKIREAKATQKEKNNRRRAKETMREAVEERGNVELGAQEKNMNNVNVVTTPQMKGKLSKKHGESQVANIKERLQEANTNEEKRELAKELSNMFSKEFLTNSLSDINEKLQEYQEAINSIKSKLSKAKSTELKNINKELNKLRKLLNQRDNLLQKLEREKTKAKQTKNKIIRKVKPGEEELLENNYNSLLTEQTQLINERIQGLEEQINEIETIVANKKQEIKSKKQSKKAAKETKAEAEAEAEAVKKVAKEVAKYKNVYNEELQKIKNILINKLGVSPTINQIRNEIIKRAAEKGKTGQKLLNKLKEKEEMKEIDKFKMITVLQQLQQNRSAENIVEELNENSNKVNINGVEYTKNDLIKMYNEEKKRINNERRKAAEQWVRNRDELKKVKEAQKKRNQKIKQKQKQNQQNKEQSEEHQRFLNFNQRRENQEKQLANIRTEKQQHFIELKGKKRTLQELRKQVQEALKTLIEKKRSTVRITDQNNAGTSNTTINTNKQLTELSNNLTRNPLLRIIVDGKSYELENLQEIGEAEIRAQERTRRNIIRNKIKNTQRRIEEEESKNNKNQSKINSLKEQLKRQEDSLETNIPKSRLRPNIPLNKRTGRISNIEKQRLKNLVTKLKNKLGRKPTPEEVKEEREKGPMVEVTSTPLLRLKAKAQ